MQGDPEESGLTHTFIHKNLFFYGALLCLCLANPGKKIGKRKRKLLVDQTKELSNDFIRQQICNSSDLVAPLDMAPPTAELMQWKESGAAHKLFSQPCSSVVNPQMKEVKLFTVSNIILTLILLVHFQNLSIGLLLNFNSGTSDDDNL